MRLVSAGFLPFLMFVMFAATGFAQNVSCSGTGAWTITDQAVTCEGGLPAGVTSVTINGYSNVTFYNLASVAVSVSGTSNFTMNNVSVSIDTSGNSYFKAYNSSRIGKAPSFAGNSTAVITDTAMASSCGWHTDTFNGYSLTFINVSTEGNGDCRAIRFGAYMINAINSTFVTSQTGGYSGMNLNATIFNITNSTLKVVSILGADNSAIFLQNGTMTAANSTITGLAYDYNSNRTLTLVNITSTSIYASGNATTDGGPNISATYTNFTIYLRMNASSSVTIYNSTLTDGTFYGNVTMTNSIGNPSFYGQTTILNNVVGTTMTFNGTSVSIIGNSTITTANFQLNSTVEINNSVVGVSTSNTANVTACNSSLSVATSGNSYFKAYNSSRIGSAPSFAGNSTAVITDTAIASSCGWHTATFNGYSLTFTNVSTESSGECKSIRFGAYIINMANSSFRTGGGGGTSAIYLNATIFNITNSTLRSVGDALPASGTFLENGTMTAANSTINPFIYDYLYNVSLTLVNMTPTSLYNSSTGTTDGGANISATYTNFTTSLSMGLLSNVTIYNSTLTAATFNGNATIIDSTMPATTFSGSSIVNATNTTFTSKSFSGNGTLFSKNLLYLGVKNPYTGSNSFLTGNVTITSNYSTTEASDLTFGQSEYANDSTMVGWWHFNNGSGTHAVDNSSYGNNGTIFGATWNTSGKFGNALTFNRTNGVNVTVPDSVSLDITKNITLEAWVMLNQVGIRNVILDKELANSGYALEIYSDNIVYFYAINSNWCPQFGGSTALSAGQWYHIAATYDGIIGKIYVNGVQETLGYNCGTSGTINANNEQLTIGYALSGTNPLPFNGTIDEVAIYNRSLSAAEIADQYHKYKPFNLINYKQNATGQYNYTLNISGTADGIYYITPALVNMTAMTYLNVSINYCPGNSSGNWVINDLTVLCTNTSNVNVSGTTISIYGNSNVTFQNVTNSSVNINTYNSSNFTANNASLGRISAYNSSDVSLVNNTRVDIDSYNNAKVYLCNATIYGGTGFIETVSFAGANVTIVNSTVAPTNNQGHIIFTGTNLTIINSTIIGTSQWGVIRFLGNTNATITNSLVLTPYAGGSAVDYSIKIDNSNITLINSTVSTSSCYSSGVGDYGGRQCVVPSGNSFVTLNNSNVTDILFVINNTNMSISNLHANNYSNFSIAVPGRFNVTLYDGRLSYATLEINGSSAVNITYSTVAVRSFDTSILSVWNTTLKRADSGASIGYVYLLSFGGNSISCTDSAISPTGNQEGVLFNASSVNLTRCTVTGSGSWGQVKFANDTVAMVADSAISAAGVSPGGLFFSDSAKVNATNASWTGTRTFSDNATLYNKTWLFLGVKDTSGKFLRDADVLVTSNMSTTEINTTTNASGFVPATILIDFMQNATATYTYQHTVNVSAMGGAVFNATFYNMTTAKYLNATLNGTFNYVGEAEYLNDSSLVGWWHFNEGVGASLNDSSGNLNNGTISGASWNLTSGKFGNALDFDGIDDQVTVAPSATLNNLPTGDFTVVAWVKIGSIATEMRLLDKRSTAGGWFFEVNDNGGSRPRELIFYAEFTSGTCQQFAINAFGTDVYTQLVAVFSSATKTSKLYSNAVELTPWTNTAGSGTALDDSAKSLKFGAYQDAQLGHLDGVLDEVAIYNRTLSAAEIADHYANSSLAKINASNFSAINMTINTGYLNYTKPYTGIQQINILDGNARYANFSWNFSANGFLPKNISIAKNDSAYWVGINGTNGMATLYVNKRTNCSIKICANKSNYSECSFADWQNYSTAFLLGSNDTTCFVSVNGTVAQDWPLTMFNLTNYTPYDADDVDPDIILNVSANVSASLGTAIHTVILQYMRSGDPGWTNLTMSNSSPYIFNASFNISSPAGNWLIRAWANNSYGGENVSGQTTVNATLEKTWRLSPASATLSTLVNTNTSYLLTINNTGDYPLYFTLSEATNVSYNLSSTDWNASLSFDLNSSSTAKELRPINVTLAVGSSEGESAIKINVSAPSTASPTSNSSNITLIAYKAGPYVRAVVVSNPDSTYQSTKNHTFAAYVENRGNETATNVTVNWTFPDAGWSANATGFLTNLTVNQQAWFNITANLSSQAYAGSRPILFRATYLNGSNATLGAQRNDSTNIIVLCNGTDGVCGLGCTQAEDFNCYTGPTTGGGGGQAAGGGGGASTVKFSYSSVPARIESSRGTIREFYITINNTKPDVTLEDLSVSINGYLAQYVQVVPINATFVPSGGTAYFKVLLTVPSYLEEKAFNISYLLTGRVVRGGNASTPLLENMSLLFYVYEFGRDESTAALSSIQEQIDNMSAAGLPTAKIRQLLEKARKAFVEGRYGDVKQYSEEIIKQIDAAYATQGLLKEVENKLSAAKAAGLDVTRTEDLYNLAKAAFDREAFDLAKEHLNNALSIYAIETKSEFNIFTFAVNYWWLIISAAAASIIGLYVAMRTTAIKRLDDQIEELTVEEVRLNNLLQETQADYFRRGALTEIDYHKAMYLYREKLTQVKEEITAMRAKKAGMLTLTKEMDTLKEELEKLKALMRQAQDEYFNKQSIGWHVFQERMEEYRIRKVEIEESMAFLEAKLAKDKMLKKGGKAGGAASENRENIALPSKKELEDEKWKELKKKKGDGLRLPSS